MNNNNNKSIWFFCILNTFPICTKYFAYWILSLMNKDYYHCLLLSTGARELSASIYSRSAWSANSPKIDSCPLVFSITDGENRLSRIGPGSLRRLGVSGRLEDTSYVSIALSAFKCRLATCVIIAPYVVIRGGTTRTREWWFADYRADAEFSLISMRRYLLLTVYRVRRTIAVLPLRSRRW